MFCVFFLCPCKRCITLSRNGRILLSIFTFRILRNSTYFSPQAIHRCFSQANINIQYYLAHWSRVFPEKLTVSQLLKKFPAFYGIRKFITASTTARQHSHKQQCDEFLVTSVSYLLAVTRTTRGSIITPQITQCVTPQCINSCIVLIVATQCVIPQCINPCIVLIVVTQCVIPHCRTYSTNGR